MYLSRGPTLSESFELGSLVVSANDVFQHETLPKVCTKLLFLFKEKVKFN